MTRTMRRNGFHEKRRKGKEGKTNSRFAKVCLAMETKDVSTFLAEMNF